MRDILRIICVVIKKIILKPKVKNQTYWKTKSRFEFQGYMRIVGSVLPGIFKRRSEAVMKDFKAFAEQGCISAGLIIMKSRSIDTCTWHYIYKIGKFYITRLNK